jgi:hypothetical protein
VNWLYLIPWALLTAVLVFAAYWSGRSTGESVTYEQQREKHDRLREENIALKLLNEKLRGLAGYPEVVSTTVAVKDSPGASALADPASAPM